MMEWRDAISITGRWAWSLTAPPDIAQACARLAAFLYKQRDAQLFDVTAIEAGTVITTRCNAGRCTKGSACRTWCRND